MQFVRPAFATNPRRFGKGQARTVALRIGRTPTLSDDLRLFAATFFAGFLFVSILIG